MSKKRLAVLTMLVVILLVFNIPASAQVVGSAGVTAASSSTFAASSTSFGAFGGFGGFSGFGGFGGFAFPFNWGFVPFGVGPWPFNWALGGGVGPFPLLGWNRFSPGCFGTIGCGLGGLAPNAAPIANAPLGGIGKGLAKTAVAQALPFITGSPLGGAPVLGWDVSPWAFGLQSCVRSLPLYFGAYGFGFPFSLGNWRVSLIPPLCAPPCAPLCAPLTAPIANAPMGIGK